MPYTEFAITCGIRVPSPHEETVRVNEVPDAPLMEKLQPVAVPELEKSELATEFTFCENTIEYVIEEFVLVGVD